MTSSPDVVPRPFELSVLLFQLLKFNNIYIYLKN